MAESETTDKLSKQEREVLYHIYKGKFMAGVRHFSLGYIQSEYLEFNRADLQNILKRLLDKGYIVQNKPDEFGIPDAKKFQEIRRFLWRRRAFDWLKSRMLRTWSYLWNHFIITIIVSIIVSIITAYLTTRLINK